MEVIQPSHPHSRNPVVPKFEDLCQEETQKQERWTRRAAWDLADEVCKSRGNLDPTRALVFSLLFDWCLCASSTIEPEERESVVDFGASTHVQQEDLNSAELETVHISRNRTKVITASGEVHTNEDATRDLDLFLTVQLLEDTPSTIFRGHFREDHGFAWSG